HEHLADEVTALPSLRTFEVSQEQAAEIPLLEQRSDSPLLRFKLMFQAGSAFDPRGKEGLAALTAAMIADGGSARHRIDEINRALFPIAGSFEAQVDREAVTLTGVVHRDEFVTFARFVLPQLTDPGYREDDFVRLKEAQVNALVQ